MTNPGIDRDRISPQFLTELADPLARLYEALQHDLIVNLARQFNVMRIKGDIPTSFAWRSYMLAQLGGLTRESLQIIAGYTGDLSEATKLAVRTAVEKSIAVVDKSFAQEVARDDYTPNVADTAARVTEYYLNQALDRQNMVNTVMLNSTRGQYEKTVGRVGEELDRRLARAQGSLNAAAGGVILGSDDFQSAVRRCVSEMTEEGLTGFYDRAGREWSAQAYVTMDVRTTAANAAREAAMERNREYGNELIAVSSHPGARPLCEPYQGGVYSTDGSTGETQDLHGATISYYPLELTSYGEAAGLFGINCGHYPSPFIAGMSVVRKLDISHEENERLYKESQQQRYMERRIQAQKTKADALAAAGDAAGAKAARMRAREMNKELKGWCAEKGRAYYPERVRVTRGEKTESGSTRQARPYAAQETHSSIVSASRSYVNDDSLFVMNMSKVPPISGHEDFKCHGRPYYLEIDTNNGQTEKYNAKQFADILKSDPSYAGGDIRLLACSTGKREDGFACQLAKRLHVNVMAPTEDLWVDEDGNMFITDIDDLAQIWYIDKDIKPTGYWRLFYPDGHWKKVDVNGKEAP